VHRQYTFRREPKTVRAARDVLHGLNGHFPKARLNDASLCLTELVSNAVRHPRATGDLGLTLEVGEDRLRVEVADPGPGFEPGAPTKGDEGGWGLYIVDRVADEWGVEARERTVVWFEILRAPRFN
jgi:anti-sigma regulatory factor (Ser/Thr protein kinase)